MSDIISVEETDVKIMNPEALQFFADEISRGNTILVLYADGLQKEIKSSKAWDEFLRSTAPANPPVKKNYRI